MALLDFLGNSGIYFLTGVSRSTLPSACNLSNVTAVKSFVILAILNLVFELTGTLNSRLANPK